MCSSDLGERVSEFSLYKRVGDDDDDIVGNYQIVDQARKINTGRQERVDLHMVIAEPNMT